MAAELSVSAADFAFTGADEAWCRACEMENLKRRKQLLQWYAGKRNQKLGKHIRYQLFPVRLEGTVWMKKGWEMELIRLVSEMKPDSFGGRTGAVCIVQWDGAACHTRGTVQGIPGIREGNE